MLISRSPLRISLGGGGTDLPSYYKKKGAAAFIAIPLICEDLFDCTFVLNFVFLKFDN